MTITKLRHKYFSCKPLRFWQVFLNGGFVILFLKKVDIKSQILPELIILRCLYFNIWTRFYLLLCTWRVRSGRPEEFFKKGVLKNSANSQESICAGVSFSIKLQAGCMQLHNMQNLVQVLSCKFSEIFIRISTLQTSARACL